MIGSSDVVRREDRLRQLEMAVTRKLDGLLQGDHQGLVPGRTRRCRVASAP